MKLLARIALALVPVLLAAAPLKVDFSIAGRADSFAPGYDQWLVSNGAASDTKTAGGVTFTVRAIAAGAGGAALTTTWTKGDAIPGAKMAVDGVTLAGPASGGQLELRIAGLAPGRHTLATFHNYSEGAAAAAPLDILVDGARQVVALTPTYRVKSDSDAACAYLTLEAQAGRDVVIAFVTSTGAAQSAARHAVLCGLELDGSDPRRRAAKPVPADRDEHVDADARTLTVAWQAPSGAKRFAVYLGAERAAVASATPAAAEFKGRATEPRYTFTGLSSHVDYFWRVDAIDGEGGVTAGEVWHFRPRQLAFPGAEGYGRFARGGRGGRVIEVTNLDDSGPGSLRAAVEAEGPRTVVFAVSGVITLETKLVIKNPYITVAGQTAPGQGITLRKFNFGLMGTHDAIVRFVRVRPGNISGTTLDGMGMAASDHCTIDHASISWTIDEAFSSRAAQHITLQRTLISEALNEAGHKKYPTGSRHGYAASIGGLVGSFHHNLLAHCSGRNWSLAGGLDQSGRHTGWLDLRNNVVFNWDNRTTDGGAAKVQFVGNYYKPGPASRVFYLLKPERNNIEGFGPQDYYVFGNVMEGRVAAEDRLGGVVAPEPRRPRRTGDQVANHDDAPPRKAETLASFVKDEPFFESFVTTQSARAAYKIVLSDVGCTQPALDAHDARVIRETLEGNVTYRGSKTGFPGLPDSQDDVGGWEKHPEARRPANFDTDHDGLPDWWETLHRLNPRSAAGDVAESNADPDGDGFTRLEDYLNWLAEPHVEGAVGAAVEINLAALTGGFTAKPVHAVASATHGAAALLADGRTLRFTPAKDFRGLAAVTFTVADAEGDALTQRIGIAVR